MGGKRIFLKTFRASLFNEDQSNKPNFSRKKDTLHCQGRVELRLRNLPKLLEWGCEYSVDRPWKRCIGVDIESVDDAQRGVKSTLDTRGLIVSTNKSSTPLKVKLRKIYLYILSGFSVLCITVNSRNKRMSQYSTDRLGTWESQKSGYFVRVKVLFTEFRPVVDLTHA